MEPSYRHLMDVIRSETDCLYMCNVPVPNARSGELDIVVERWDEGDQHVIRSTVRAGNRTLTTVKSYADAVKTVWTREHPLKNLASQG